MKIIIENFDKTVFVEEALHRLVEIHFHLGLEDEAKKYASILGYNYNSSRWFQQSYKILDKNYKIIDLAKKDKINKKDNFFKKIIKNKIILCQIKIKIIDKHKKIITEIKKHNKFYFSDDEPKIIDSEYDKIKKTAIELEKISIFKKLSIYRENSWSRTFK